MLEMTRLIFSRWIDDERLTANGFDVCLKTGKQAKCRLERTESSTK